MEMAEELDLPVQIHTGHMAGIRNEISKTNAVHFTSVLQLHQNVKFDLFHGNWPYMGEILFLAKNYPNVHIDLCWVNIIDPYYLEENSIEKKELKKNLSQIIEVTKLFAEQFDYEVGESTVYNGEAEVEVTISIEYSEGEISTYTEYVKTVKRDDKWYIEGEWLDLEYIQS